MIVAEDPAMLEIDVGVSGASSDARPRLLAPARSARGARSTVTTPSSATSMRSPARIGGWKERSRPDERAARADLLPRAVLQDGEEGARPDLALRSRRPAIRRSARDLGRRGRRARRRARVRDPGRRVARRVLARRQHLHRLALPRARGPARSRAAALDRRADRHVLVRQRLHERVLLGCRRCAGDRADRGARILPTCSQRASRSRSRTTKRSWR